MPTLQEVVLDHIDKKIDEKMEETIQNKVMKIVNENKTRLQGHVMNLGNNLIVPTLDYIKNAKSIELGNEFAKQLCVHKQIKQGGASRKRKPRKQRISRRRKKIRKQHGGTIDANIAMQLGVLGKLFTNAMDKNMPMYQYILQQPEKVMEELQKTLHVSVKEIKENRTFMYELFRLIICEFDKKIKNDTFPDSGGTKTPEKLNQIIFTTTFHNGIDALNTTLTIDNKDQGAKEIVELLMKNNTVIKDDIGEYCNQHRNSVKNANEEGLLRKGIDTINELVTGIIPNKTSTAIAAAGG